MIVVFDCKFKHVEWGVHIKCNQSETLRVIITLVDKLSLVLTRLKM